MNLVLCNLQKLIKPLMMKNVKLSLMLIMVITFSILSCNKNNTENNDNNSIPMDELVVSETFNWATTQDIIVKIYAKDNQGIAMNNVLVSVYTGLPEEGGLLMAKGVTNDQGFFTISRPVGAYYETLVLGTSQIGLVNFIEVPIVNGIVEYTFGGVQIQKKSTSWVSPKSTNSQIAFLGTYDGNGVPDYLEPVDDPISGDFMADLNNSFPEGQPLSTTHPDYLSTDYEHDLLLECSTTVWVTFVSEGAGYRNVLGFYTYDLNSPPTSTNDIETITVIFPNTSFQGSGGGLHAGNKVEIGTFPENTGIGWVLIADGFRGGTVTDGYNYLYSERGFNPETNPSLQQHSVLLYDPGRELTILAWEDIQRDNAGSDPYTCDQDFNDVMYYVTIDPEPCAILDFPVVDYTGVDSDGDNIPDALDDYPGNINYAFNNYYPCNVAFGTLAYEDLWPGKGDYDFNDLVLNYNINQITNGSNKIVRVDSELKIMAHGATFNNGFGFEFTVDPSHITSITGQDLQEDYITTNGNGTEANQSNAVVIAFDNTYNILPSPGSGIGVNTTPGAPYVTPVTINLSIEFDQPYTSAEIGIPPFNPFLIIDGDRSKEIHLPDHLPTELAGAELFGTQHDNSIPAIGRYYKTEANLPWAIDIWFDFKYPNEKTQVTSAHLKFADWAQSDGINYMDWYEDEPGYRDDSKIYQIP